MWSSGPRQFSRLFKEETGQSPAKAGGAEDFSASLRQRDLQIFTLASLEFAACQDSGCICRRGEHSGRSVRGLEPVELQKATLGEDDGALDRTL